MQPAAAVARRAARPWVGPIARVGLATKGVLYLLVGALALLWAAGEGGGTVSGSHGAVRTFRQAPYGDVLLWGVAVGLAAYAVWRLLQAAIDLDRKGGWKGAFQRIGYGVSAAVYGGLALTAVQLARGERGGDHQESKTWVARALSQPYGDVLIALVGVGVAGYGLYHFWSAIRASFEKELDLGRMSRRQRALALWVGRIGTVARGVVFLVIGYHLVLAGLHSSPRETRDVGGALRTLAQRPHGDLILGVIAVGLFLYGAFMLTRARVGRIPGSDS